MKREWEKEKERANALKQRERNVRLLRKRGIRSNLQARIGDFVLRIEIAIPESPILPIGTAAPRYDNWHCSLMRQLTLRSNATIGIAPRCDNWHYPLI